jgi:hypothetical protein
LADPHPDPEFDVELPWECAGHPMPTLPLLVDGVEIDTDTDLAALADEVIASGAPDGALALYQDFPAAWLVRLYVRLHGLREADVLSRHLAARLVGGDPATRGAALVFWGCQARADGFDQILALGEALSCAEAARDYLTPHGSRHTATSLLASLTARLALSAHDENDLDRRTLALIRRYLLEPGFPGHRGFVASLVARDAEWLVRNAPGIAAASPRVLPLLLDGLVRADAEELVAVAGVAVVRSGDEAGRAALAAWLRAPANASAPWTEVLAPLLGR